MTEKYQDMEWDPTYNEPWHRVGHKRCQECELHGKITMLNNRHDNKMCMLCMDTMRPTDESN